MPEPTTPPVPTPPATPTPPIPPNPEPQGDPADLGDAGKKALAAERDARKIAEQSAKDLQAQIDKINQANESAIEKAQRESKEATEAATKATVQSFRDAAVKFGGISKEDAELFLTATDSVTLAKQAERLVAQASANPAGPRPDLSQGPKSTPATGTPEQDFASFLGAQLSS